MHTTDYQRDETDMADKERPRCTVYIIVFWDGSHIRDKIKKVCDGFSG